MFLLYTEKNNASNSVPQYLHVVAVIHCRYVRKPFFFAKFCWLGIFYSCLRATASMLTLLTIQSPFAATAKPVVNSSLKKFSFHGSYSHNLSYDNIRQRRIQTAVISDNCDAIWMRSRFKPLVFICAKSCLLPRTATFLELLTCRSLLRYESYFCSIK